MQNKSIRQREDAGWAQMRRQLDLDMPVHKKDRKIIWLFLFAGLGLTGLIFFANRVFNSPEAPVLPQSRPLEETAKVSNPAENPSRDLSLDESQAAADTGGVNSEKPETDATILSNDIEPVNQAVANHSSRTGQDAKTLLKARKSPSPSSTAIHREKGSTATGAETIKSSVPQKSTDLPAAVPEENLALNQKKTNPLPEVPTESEPKEEAAETASPKDEQPKDELPAVAANPGIQASGISNSGNVNLIASAEAEMENPVEIKTENPRKRHGYLSMGADYAGDHFTSPYLTGGLRLPVSGRFFIAGQAGLSYQIKKGPSGSSNSTVTLSSQSYGKHFLDAGNASSGSNTLDADDLFIDKNRSLTSFSGDSLLLTAGDQVTYYSSNQWMALAQLGLGYRILPGLSIESGLHYRYYTGSFRDFVSIKSTNPFGNGFNTSSSATFKLNPAVSRQQFSLYLNTGLRLTNHLGLVMQVAGKPFSLSSSVSRVESAGLNTSASNQKTALVLPVKQNSAYYRLGLTLSF
ncbi:MAG TPA: hypothetical protein PKM27_06845 [Saprospiraceae bacterium]|nr:hypothetical protein [Saprospiraceae bacterium]